MDLKDKTIYGFANVYQFNSILFFCFSCRKSKVFLKYSHIEQLKDLLDKMGQSVVHLQKGKEFKLVEF